MTGLLEMNNMGDPSCVFTCMRWGDVIDDLLEVVFAIDKALESFCANKSIQLTFKSWCAYDKQHIYTCWPKGQIPSKVIDAYNLDEDCMFDDDWKLYLEHIEKMDTYLLNDDATKPAEDCVLYTRDKKTPWCVAFIFLAHCFYSIWCI